MTLLHSFRSLSSYASPIAVTFLCVLTKFEMSGISLMHGTHQVAQ